MKYAFLLAAIVSEVIIILLFVLNQYHVIGLSFLWLNVVGAVLVVLLSSCLQVFFPSQTVVSTPEPSTVVLD